MVNYNVIRKILKYKGRFGGAFFYYGFTKNGFIKSINKLARNDLEWYFRN